MKEAKKYQSKIVVKMGSKAAEATKRDTVTVEAEGGDEDVAVNGMKAFFENNF